jgi:hypothetical protein
VARYCHKPARDQIFFPSAMAFISTDKPRIDRFSVRMNSTAERTVCKLAGDEHRYNQKEFRNNELVVCRPAMRDKVLAALAAAGALEAE